MSAKDRIITLLETNRLTYPRVLIQRELASDFSIEQITGAIHSLMDDYKIDLVLDYPSDESLSVSHPIWHLKILSESEIDNLQKLTPIEYAVIRLLQHESPIRFPGELKIVDVKKLLADQDYPIEDVEFLYVEDFFDTIRILVEGEQDFVWCFRLIPEYEKTEEYKREMERITREWDERYLKQGRQQSVVDIAASIVLMLKDEPDGFSREKIVSMLPSRPKTHIADAFKTVLNQKYIRRVAQPSGKEWYCSCYNQYEQQIDQKIREIVQRPRFLKHLAKRVRLAKGNNVDQLAQFILELAEGFNLHDVQYTWIAERLVRHSADLHPELLDAVLTEIMLKTIHRKKK